jgi:hypothetical protein
MGHLEGVRAFPMVEGSFRVAYEDGNPWPDCWLPRGLVQ